MHVEFEKPHSVVWCDRVKYEVVESRERIMESLSYTADPEAVRGWIYVTPAFSPTGNQIALNSAFISSVAPYGDSGV